MLPCLHNTLGRKLTLPSSKRSFAYRQMLNSSGPSGIGKQTSTDPEPETGAATAAEAMPAPNPPVSRTTLAATSGRMILEFIQQSSM
ncbi:hypothetical protein GCM10027088_45040 [Nocardia goodfellowii]